MTQMFIELALLAICIVATYIATKAEERCQKLEDELKRLRRR